MQLEVNTVRAGHVLLHGLSRFPFWAQHVLIENIEIVRANQAQLDFGSGGGYTSAHVLLRGDAQTDEGSVGVTTTLDIERLNGAITQAMLEEATWEQETFPEFPRGLTFHALRWLWRRCGIRLVQT